MNPYDKAHELSRALKESSEYRAFLAAKGAIEGDADAKKMVRDFISKQMELEYEAMSGKTPDAAKTENLQRLYQLIALNTKAREFMEAYMRFQRTMADISKIIGDSVAEGLDIFAKD
jgi:cell fate (sporulation/competence/biofilm development) regulator YlbF (YheA/YmcA/DUF963 family)